MQPAQTGPGSVPLVRYTRYAAADAIIEGSVLVYNASGELALAGADPALIAGIALQAKDTAPGYQAANNPVVSTYRQQKLAAAIADRNSTFSAAIVNGSAVRIPPIQADVGAQYGITNLSGIWVVDKAKTTTAARVQVVAIDLERNQVLFKILTDHIAGFQ